MIECSNKRIKEYTSATTLFHNTTKPGNLGIHLNGNLLLAERTELEPKDFKEFLLNPYRLFDLEMEAALVSPKVEKEEFISLPAGYARRIRFNPNNKKTSLRETWSGAIALRAFQKQKKHHYQLDILSATLIKWESYTDLNNKVTEAKKLSLGYQRLSPDINWLEIWLLFGWGWFNGSNQKDELLTRIGVEIDKGKNFNTGFRFDKDYTLNMGNRSFSGVYHLRLYNHINVHSIIKCGLSYEYVNFKRSDTLHAINPEISVKHFNDVDIILGIKYRIRILKSNEPDGIPENQRFNISMDFLF